jgi:hypothetical protein
MLSMVYQRVLMKMGYSGKRNGASTKKLSLEDGAQCLLSRNIKDKMDFCSNGASGKKSSQEIIKLLRIGLKN